MEKIERDSDMFGMMERRVIDHTRQELSGHIGAFMVSGHCHAP